MNATATATATATAEIVRTPEEIAARLESWFLTQQPCWAILPTPSGVLVEVYGRLNTRPGSHDSYNLRASDPHSHVAIPLSAVEAVGLSCSFLKH